MTNFDSPHKDPQLAALLRSAAGKIPVKGLHASELEQRRRSIRRRPLTALFVFGVALAVAGGLLSQRQEMKGSRTISLSNRPASVECAKTKHAWTALDLNSSGDGYPPAGGASESDARKVLREQAGVAFKEGEAQLGSRRGYVWLRTDTGAIAFQVQRIYFVRVNVPTKAECPDEPAFSNGTPLVFEYPSGSG